MYNLFSDLYEVYLYVNCSQVSTQGWNRRTGVVYGRDVGTAATI